MWIYEDSISNVTNTNNDSGVNKAMAEDRTIIRGNLRGKEAQNSTGRSCDVMCISDIEGEREEERGAQCIMQVPRESRLMAADLRPGTGLT